MYHISLKGAYLMFIHHQSAFEVIYKDFDSSKKICCDIKGWEIIQYIVLQ